MDTRLNLTGTLGLELTLFFVLFVLIATAVMWGIPRITGINRLFGVGRFYAKLPPSRDGHGNVELAQLADNIDRLADYLKDRSIASVGHNAALDSVEYRLASDLAELARCARNMKLFLDRNSSALLDLLPFIVDRLARPQRLLIAPPQPTNDQQPSVTPDTSFVGSDTGRASGHLEGLAHRTVVRR
jgi:hypothetical protein